MLHPKTIPCRVLAAIDLGEGLLLLHELHRECQRGRFGIILCLRLHIRRVLASAIGQRYCKTRQLVIRVVCTFLATCLR